jgi:hypothetical protein
MAPPADRQIPMWLLFLYLSAVVLPGGILLVILHRLWLQKKQRQ